MWINPFALLIYDVLMCVSEMCWPTFARQRRSGMCCMRTSSDSVLRRLQCLHFDTAESSLTWDFCIGASLSLGVCEVGCRKKKKILNKTETINSERKSKIDLHFALCVPNHPNFLHFNLSFDSLLEHPAPQNALFEKRVRRHGLLSYPSAISHISCSICCRFSLCTWQKLFKIRYAYDILLVPPSTSLSLSAFLARPCIHSIFRHKQHNSS